MNDKFFSFKIKKIMQKSLFVGIFIAFLVGCPTPSGTNKQTDPDGKHPETIDPYTTNLGNYTIHNFMCSTTATKIDGRVDEWLSKAETYLKGLAADFGDVNEIQNEDVKNLINVLNNDSTYKTSNMTGFDPMINRLNNACAPLFEQIIEKIDTPVDRARFIRYYQAINNEAYKFGWGNYFDDNPANTETQEATYANQKANVITAWDDIHYDYNETKPIDDIGSDIENGCPQIINQMGMLLKNSNVANEMGITEDVLNKVISTGFSAGCDMSSLSALHDYAAKKKLTQHESCVISSESNLVNVMIKKHIELGTGLAMIIQNDMERGLC